MQGHGLGERWNLLQRAAACGQVWTNAPSVYAFDTRFLYRVRIVPDVLLNTFARIPNAIRPYRAAILQANYVCGANCGDRKGRDE